MAAVAADVGGAAGGAAWAEGVAAAWLWACAVGGCVCVWGGVRPHAKPAVAVVQRPCDVDCRCCDAAATGGGRHAVAGAAVASAAVS